MRGTFAVIVLSTAMFGQSVTPLMAQAQAQAGQRDRPVPLPSPVPDRPVPLPRPVPDRPQIQPPRPTPGRPEIQPPRPIPGRPEIQPPRPIPGRPQPPRPNPGYPGYDQNRGYSGRISCESRNNRTVRCNARTENRVVLLTRSGGSACTQGRSWGYDSRSIWVSRNCRGTFGYGYGNNWGGGGHDRPDRDKGPSTGLIVGGVAVAAGLIALLASRKDRTPAEASAPATPPAYPPGPPAQISADLSSVQTAARPSLQTCLFEASRQIGATGGTRLRFDRLKTIEPGNGGWRFAADLTATYPDGDRSVPIYCRATPSQVIQLDFTS